VILNPSVIGVVLRHHVLPAGHSLGLTAASALFPPPCLSHPGFLCGSLSCHALHIRSSEPTDCSAQLSGMALMRGSRIFLHTEKVGGRRTARTVWDRACRSPEGALGEESIANTSTTANRCFARSATTRPFIGQRPRISFGITSRCVLRFGRSSRSPPMQSKLVMAQKRANRTRASWRDRPQTLLRCSHPVPCREHRPGPAFVPIFWG
jgi:hypothetical protein